MLAGEQAGRAGFPLAAPLPQAPRSLAPFQRLTTDPSGKAAQWERILYTEWFCSTLSHPQTEGNA